MRDFEFLSCFNFLSLENAKKYSRLVYPQSYKPFEPLLALLSLSLLSFWLHRLCRVAGLSVYSFRVLSSITFWSPRDPPSLIERSGFNPRGFISEFMFEDATRNKGAPITNVDGFKLKGGLNSFIF